MSTYFLQVQVGLRTQTRTYAHIALHDSLVCIEFDFQIGSRVLKNGFKPILMHIYGMQYNFMHRSC